MDCYLNTMGGPPDGSGNALNFNAAQCYPGDFSGGGGSTTPPTSAISFPPNDTTVSSTITVSGTASPGSASISSVAISIDGGTYQPVSGTTSWTFSLNTTSLSNGSHTLAAKATDSSGNVGISPAVTITVNNATVTKPAITSSLTANATTTIAFSYQITASNNPTSYNATNLPSGLSVNTATGVISGTPTAAGTSNVTISATNSGGTGTATLAITVANLAPDTTPPSVPANLSVGTVTTSTVSLSWAASTDPTVNGQTTSGLAGYKVYRCTGSSCTPSVQVGTSTTASFTNIGLVSSTAYTYAVSAYDNAGNISAKSAGATATTNAQPDTTPPTVSLTAPANNATVSGSVTVSATASDNVGVVSVQFKLDGANLGNPVTSAPYQVFWNSAGSTNGTHTLTAVASDAAGNMATAATVTVTVNNVIAPAITSALSANATVSSPFSYAITASNNPTSYSATGLPSGLSVNTATGLISGTPSSAGTYNITISATNSAGTGSATLALTVTNAVDTQPPTIPQNLTLTSKTTSTLSFSWSASTDNFAVAGYKIYRCTGSSCSPATQVGTTANTTYTDTGLAPATLYTYAVSAYDAAGNNSAESASVLAATQALPDTTPPTTSITSPAPGAVISGIASPVTATASDNVGVTQVQLYVDGSLADTDATSPYTFSLDTTPYANGTHALQAKAYDAAGNVGTSTIVSVAVDNIPETLTASLSAAPTSGTAPVSVSLTVTAGGTAQGTINYIFYCNRTDTGTNVTAPADLTVDSVSTNPYLAPNVCSYQTAGTYTAKVIIEQGSAPPAQAQQAITVSGGAVSSTPLISSITVGQITDTSAQVTVTLNATSSVAVNYGTAPSYGNSTQASPELSTVFVNLANLTQQTTYHFDVIATPQGSATSTTSQDFTFTTQATPSSGGGGGGGSSGGGGGGSSGGGYSGGGGGGGGSVSSLFTVSAFVTTTTPTTAKVVVTDSIPAISQIFYGLTTAYGSTTIASLPLATSYFNLTGLISGKTYHLKAVSLAEGTTESSPDIVFTPGTAASIPPSPSQPSSNFPTFTRNLSVGSTGPDVQELQTLLVSLGYLKATPTGYYGALTEAAVAAFQRANGISPVGSVGPLTRAKLNSLIGSSAQPAPTAPPATSGAITQNLSLDSSGPQVTLLQQILTKDGDYTGPVTGYYGLLTEQGVENFQTAYDIISYGSPLTTGYGAVGPKTREELDAVGL